MTARELVTIWKFKIDSSPLHKLEKSIGSMKESIKGLGEFILGEGASLFGLAETTADAGVGFKRTAEEVGTTTQRLQELNYAAKQWDVSTDAVRLGLRQLSRVSTQAINGSSQAIRILHEAGVTSFTDGAGRLLRSDQLMDQIARKFKTMPNDILKVGLSAEVFGRSGSQLMPILNRWGDELNKVTKEGRDLGYVMGEEAVAQSEKFKESMNRVRAMLTGLRNELGTALMPALEEIVDKIIDWYNANRALIQSQLVEFVKEASRQFSDALVYVIDLAKWVFKLTDFVGGLGNALKIVTGFFIVWETLKTVSTIITIIEVLNKLRIAFMASAAAEALMTGGLNLIAGAAAIAAVGGAAYFGMRAFNKSVGAGTGAGPEPNMIPAMAGAAGGRQVSFSNRYEIHTAPGTSTQQASEIANIVQQKHEDFLRSAAVSVSSSVSH